MKTRRFSFLVISVLAVVLVATLVFAACDPKHRDQEAEKYTVTFDLGEATGGGISPPEPKTVEKGQSVELPSATWEGHTLLGWSDGEQQYNVGASYTPQKDVKLTAVWQDAADVSYTITFMDGDQEVKKVTLANGVALTATQIPGAPEGHDDKLFAGWFAGEQKIEAGYIPTTDVTAVAKFDDMKDDITGSGTEEDPYIINTPNGLKTFAENVNHPDVEATKDWYKAYFELGYDIDMAGVKYIPAGSRATKIGTDEGGSDIIDVLGFQGEFDGNGHTISNLTIEQNVPSTAYIGLFGFTKNQAYIHNFKLTNVTIKATAGADSDKIVAYIGAVAGYLGMSQIDRVEAEVTVKMQWYTSNKALIGGIAGMFHSDGGYIAYAENIKTKLNVEIEDFETGTSVSVLDTAYVGGLFGQLYAGSSSAAAIVNVSSESNIGGGKYLGGITGTASGDNISFINAYAKSTLKPSANVSGQEMCYAGGIAGVAEWDNVIMDSFADVTVDTKVSATTAGGLVGLGSQDYFEEAQTYGLAVVNSYYKLSAGNLTPDKTFGAEATADFGKAFATGTLKWNEQSWNFDGAVPYPTATRARDINNGQYTLTLKDGSSTTTKTYGKGDKNIATIGSLEDAANSDNNVFWDWQFAEGVDYRYYVPVVKDMTLTAKRADATAILGAYEGNAVSNDHQNQVGILELKTKGEVEYTTSYSGTSTTGYFWYDGEHIIIETLDGDYMCGAVSKKGTNYEIKWERSENTGTSVSYTFTLNNDIILKGEYYSDNGDLITFTGVENVSIFLDGFDKAIQAEYSVSNKKITIDTSNSLDGIGLYFSSATITLDDNGGFTTDFVARSDRATDNKLAYKKMGAVDYSAQPFIGENYAPYMHNDYSEDRSITFNADGTVTSTYTGAPGRYYVFNGTKMKLILDGLVSTFDLVTVDESKILVGKMNRGDSAVCSTVIAKAADGKLRAYIIGADKNNAVFANDKDNYYVKNGELQEAEISGTFADGEIITIGGTKYLVSEGTYLASGQYTHPANKLTVVGDEYGTYTYDGKTFQLDGVNKATGDIEASYAINGNYAVLYNIEDDYLFVFDFKAAQQAENVVTEAANDGYRGIYYLASGEDQKYYVLMFDGAGHWILLYNKEEEGYTGNWGGMNWGTYTVNASGDLASYMNSSQKPVFKFYYNNQMVYVDAQSESSIKEKIYTAPNYKGSTDIPTFDAAGKYTGQDVELEIKADLTGTLNTKAFTARIDKTNVIVFTVDNVKYTFDASDPENITINGGAYNKVKLTKAETGEKPFPQGTWTGTINEDKCGLKGQTITFIFDADGNVEVKFDKYDFKTTYKVSGQTITMEDTDFIDYRGLANCKFTYKSDTEMSFTFTFADEYDDDTVQFNEPVNLTKQVEASDEKPFPQGTWTGTVTVKSGGGWGLGNSTITFIFAADGKVTITAGDYEFDSTYTYSGNSLTCNEAVSSNAKIYEFKFTISSDSEMELTFKIIDNDEGYGDSEFSTTLTKQVEASDETSVVGTWTGTVSSSSFSNNYGLTVTFGADNSLTLKFVDDKGADWTTLTGTYSIDGTKITSGSDFDSSTQYFSYELTKCEFTFEGGKLSFEGNFNQDGEYDYPFTVAEFTKQAEASDEKPFPQGTWSGYATCTSGMDKEHQSGEMTIKFNADGTFELEIMSKKCSGTYILDENTIKLNAPDNGSYQIETTTFTITISGSSLILTDIRIQETTEYYIWDYDATLTQA